MIGGLVKFLKVNPRAFAFGPPPLMRRVLDELIEPVYAGESSLETPSGVVADLDLGPRDRELASERGFWLSVGSHRLILFRPEI